MNNQGLGLLSHFYIAFVCFVLILGLDIRWAFTGLLVLWFLIFAQNIDRGYTLGLLAALILTYFGVSGLCNFVSGLICHK